MVQKRRSSVEIIGIEEEPEEEQKRKKQKNRKRMTRKEEAKDVPPPLLTLIFVALKQKMEENRILDIELKKVVDSKNLFPIFCFLSSLRLLQKRKRK